MIQYRLDRGAVSLALRDYARKVSRERGASVDPEIARAEVLSATKIPAQNWPAILSGDAPINERAVVALAQRLGVKPMALVAIRPGLRELNSDAS